MSFNTGNGGSGSIPHDVKAYQSAQQDQIRSQANQFGERNFLGEHTHNKGGVASGGALQAKRYKGTFTLSTIVGE